MRTLPYFVVAISLGRFFSVNEWRVEFRIFPKVMAFRPIGHRSLEFREFREELLLIDDTGDILALRAMAPPAKVTYDPGTDPATSAPVLM